MSAKNTIKVVEVMEPSGWGGVPAYVFNLLRLIDVHKFNVKLIYSSKRSDPHWARRRLEIEQRGIETIDIPMSRSISIINDFQSFIGLSKVIKDQKPDVIHLHSSKAGFLGRLSAKLVSRKIKTIYSPHGMAFNIRPYYGMIERFASMFSDKVIANSKSEAEEIIRRKIVQVEKIEVIANGLPIETANRYLSEEKRFQLRNKFNINHDDFLVVSGGRLERLKDPYTFFQCLNLLIQTRNNIYFMWLGDGDEREKISCLFNQPDVCSRMKITGWLSSQEALDCMETADVYVSTSLSESFGLMTCEAMAKGLPVIGTRITGTIDLIEDGINGILISKQTPEELAQAIEKLYSDNKLRSNMGLMGKRKFLQEFTLDQMVKHIENLYRDITRIT